MKKIEGIVLENLGFVPQKLGDLIYHEGPLLSLFIDKNNPQNYYLYKWADCDNNANRWLVLPISAQSLKNYFLTEIALKSLFMMQPYLFILDLDTNLNVTNLQITATHILPLDYLPSEKSYYSIEKYTDFAKKFTHIITNNDIYGMMEQILNDLHTIKQSLHLV